MGNKAWLQCKSSHMQHSGSHRHAFVRPGTIVSIWCLPITVSQYISVSVDQVLQTQKQLPHLHAVEGAGVCKVG